jgi:GT2 family glycosyltransferase
VIVIDNGSRDGSAEKINEWARGKDRKPVIINTGKNLGFAGGNNVGIKYAIENVGDYILLLNNDTVVERGFLEELVKAAEEKDAGIVGGKIYYYNDRETIWYKGGKLIWVLGGGIHYGKGKHEANKDSAIHEVTFITGCMMLIKKSTIERIGLLNESYFLYCEDADYCARALKNHIKMAVNLSSVIYHKENSTLGGWKPLHIYYLIRNRFIFMKKNAPDKYLLLAFYCISAIIGAVIILKWFLTQKMELTYSALRGFNDYLHGIRGQKEFRS